MYGYFRPFKSCLTGEERRLFFGYYCRLCYCLRLEGGQIARYLTTFDGALYSVLFKLAEGSETPPFFHCQKILKGNLKHYENDDTGRKVARFSIIVLGEKIRDDILDGDSGSKKAIRLLFGKMIKRSKEREPELYKVLSEGLDRINELQAEHADLDALLNSYGELTERVFSVFVPNADKKYNKVFAAVSRWAYLVDVLCDYTEDFVKGADNPLKDGDCPTLQSYFNKHYAEVLSMTKRISSELMNSLVDIKSEDTEWNMLIKIIGYSVDSVIPKLLSGEDVTYHFVKEIVGNYFETKKRNRYEKKHPKKIQEDVVR